MKNYFVLFLIFTLNFYGYSQVGQKDEKLFVGEDLTYVVKYAFFNLGEVRIKVLEKTKINNTTVYKTIAHIDSYPDLPIVSLHQIYESYIDSSLFPLNFFAEIFGDDTIFVEYNFREHSRIDMKKGKYSSSRLWLDSTT